MERTDRYTIPETHPALVGHFPDNPVVPGVVILDCVKQSVLQLTERGTVVGFPSVKFIVPLKPNQSFLVTLACKDREALSFECHHNDRLLCKGQITLNRVEMV